MTSPDPSRVIASLARDEVTLELETVAEHFVVRPEHVCGCSSFGSRRIMTTLNSLNDARQF